MKKSKYEGPARAEIKQTPDAKDLAIEKGIAGIEYLKKTKASPEYLRLSPHFGHIALEICTGVSIRQHSTHFQVFFICYLLNPSYRMASPITHLANYS